jgi:DNA-binding transcriptional LysR family regulator
MNTFHSDLRKLDLNLLLVFESLFRLGSVTQASNELCMSASAFSHALAHLRESLGDVLFVRQSNRLQPTARAQRIAGGISLALKLLSGQLGQADHFDPASSEQEFVFSATDYTAFAVLPPFIAYLQQAAPHLRIKVVYSAQKVALEDLAAGRIDFSLGYSGDAEALPTGVEALDWFSDDYVVIASQTHPRIQGCLTLEDYLSARHVVVTPWNELRGEIDAVLDALSLQRKVTVQLPTVLAAPFIIANSELIMTLPRHAVETLRSAAPIAVFEAPFTIPSYTLKVYSHSNYAHSEGHAWLRQALLKQKVESAGH